MYLSHKRIEIQGYIDEKLSLSFQICRGTTLSHNPPKECAFVYL